MSQFTSLQPQALHQLRAGDDGSQEDTKESDVCVCAAQAIGQTGLERCAKGKQTCESTALTSFQGDRVKLWEGGAYYRAVTHAKIYCSDLARNF
jgi:hypothetical protein